MPDRPHVLLITADHWPAALLGSAGHPAIQTPTLDSLATAGTRYSNAYSECPVCIPARRTLLTGMTPRSHGDRSFQTTLEMPEAPTIANCFRDAGYQTFAAGKLHVFPQRARVGFDEVLLAEEGRPHWGIIDDYDLFLGDQGYVGRQFEHGMSNNQYVARPWHLPESLHVTNWTTREMARAIRRRDPTRPAFWYLSYTHPHPPLVPPQHYWDLYQSIEVPQPHYGDWVPDEWIPEDADRQESSRPAAATLPFPLRQQFASWDVGSRTMRDTATRAFCALCTHIDHQLRLVIGTLREEGLLDDTAILFTADHGDMLGTHGLWAKRLFYEGSANVPLILVPPQRDSRNAAGTVDDRLTGLQDVMPTLLDLAGIEIPPTVDGQPLHTGDRREHSYGECNEDVRAVRMVRDRRYKLIYYPAGHHVQLFDLHDDPHELRNLADSDAHQDIRTTLWDRLLAERYGSDCDWPDDGLDNSADVQTANRGLSLQRGIHWPPPPVTPPQPGATNPGTN